MLKCPCEEKGCEFLLKGQREEQNMCKVVKWRTGHEPESFSGTTRRVREVGKPDAWYPKCKSAVQNGLCKYVDRTGKPKEV